MHEAFPHKQVQLYLHTRQVRISKAAKAFLMKELELGFNI